MFPRGLVMCWKLHLKISFWAGSMCKARCVSGWVWCFVPEGLTLVLHELPGMDICLCVRVAVILYMSGMQDESKVWSRCDALLQQGWDLCFCAWHVHTLSSISVCIASELHEGKAAAFRYSVAGADLDPLDPSVCLSTGRLEVRLAKPWWKVSLHSVHSWESISLSFAVVLFLNVV